MFQRIKETLPDNRKTALLAAGLIFLVIGQALSGSTSVYLLILHYLFFAVSVVIYLYVTITHHNERLAKKREKEKQNQENI